MYEIFYCQKEVVNNFKFNKKSKEQSSQNCVPTKKNIAKIVFVIKIKKKSFGTKYIKNKK